MEISGWDKAMQHNALSPDLPTAFTNTIMLKKRLIISQALKPNEIINVLSNQ
jgi:hypothetical protein